MNILRFLKGKIVSLFPFILFQIAEVGFALSFIIGGISYAFKSLIYIAPLLMANIYFVLSRGSQMSKAFIYEKTTRINFLNMFLVTIFLIIISIILLVSFPTRPWGYFIVAPLIAGSIFVQLLCERPTWTDCLILVQISLLSLSIIWGVSLKYPLYFGASDTLIHMHYIDTVVQNGNVTGIGIDYAYFPLYHIFNAVGIEITDLSLRNVVFIFNGIVWQAGILFAYLVFKQFSKSRIFSLLACLLLTVSVDIIFYGMYAGTMAWAYVIFLCWLYLVIRKVNLNYILLSLIVMFTLILTHHTTVLFCIPVAFVIYISQKLFTRDRLGKSTVLLLSTQLLSICFFLYLFYIAVSFAAPVGRTWTQELIMPAGAQSYGTSSFGLNAAYYSFVILCYFIAIGAVIRDKKSGNNLWSIGGIALASLIFLVFYVSGPIDLLRQSRVGLLYRLRLLVSPFVIYMVAYGVNQLMHLEYTAGKNIFKRFIQMPILITGLVVVMSVSAMLSGANAADNTYMLRSADKGTQYFKNSELALFSFIENNGDHDLTLYGDWETTRNELYLNEFGTRQIIKSGDISYISVGYLVLRFGELQRTHGLSFATSGYQDTMYRYRLEQSSSETDIVANLSVKDCAYSNGYTQLYVLSQTIKPTE